MNTKYWLLVAVVTGLVTWAGVETQRLCVAQRQMAASLELQKATSQRAELAHLKHAHAMVEEK